MRDFITGFRKFTMAMVFLVTGVVLLALGLVPADTWMQHMSSVMTAFMATNLGEHIIAVGKDWIKEKFKK